MYIPYYKDEIVTYLIGKFPSSNKSYWNKRNKTSLIKLYVGIKKGYIKTQSAKVIREVVGVIWNIELCSVMY